MVQAPSTLQAASGFCHTPRREKERKDLPWGTVEVLDIRESGKPQTGQKCSHRQNDGANERPLPQAEGREEGHNPSGYRAETADIGWRIETGVTWRQRQRCRERGAATGAGGAPARQPVRRPALRHERKF